MARRLDTRPEVSETSIRDMAHDLRISLSVVMGLSQSLLTDLGGEIAEEHATQLRMVVESGHHMCELIDATVSERSCERETDIHALCSAVIGWMRPSAEAKGLFLRVDDAGCGPAACCVAPIDAHRVTRILMNLIDNAIKYTDEGGITVFVRCQQDALALAVADTGRGMTRIELSSVFDEGFRASPASVPGTGHGLAACRRLAAEMGGLLSVRSSVPGQGATFVLWLPWGYVERR